MREAQSLGGKEEGKIGRSYDSKKKKSVCAVELTELGKVRRMYALKIDNFSAKELGTIFEKHIDPKANVTRVYGGATSAFLKIMI